MPVRGEVVLQAVRAMCPPRYALDGDKTGLQVGRTDRDVRKVLCCLDLTLAVAEEARDLGADLIVSHHAVIFRPLKDLRTDSFKGRILETLIKHDVAVYVPHTALDVVAGGMNDHLAASVGLQDPRPLEATGSEPVQLLTVTVDGDPAGLEAKLTARGAREVKVGGGRVEALVTTRRAGAVAKALEQATGQAPRVHVLAGGVDPRGIGRVGKLAEPEPLAALAARLKTSLGAPGVRVVAVADGAVVRKAAVLGGDGRRFVKAALFAGADVLVTGDVDHHTALEARAQGLSLIDVGHWASEKQVAELLVAGLRERLADEDVEILPSRVDTNPFAFV
jgi:dinuclear metal center YbgI/SA1388 family protein